MTWITRFVTCALGLTLAGTSLAADNDYTLAVSEGTSGGIDHARVLTKYGGLAEALGRALRGKVRIVFAREFALLEEGLSQQRFDLAMARPSDYPARAMRDHGYRFVASARPEGQCLIVVPAASPLQRIEDAKGKRWALPEQVSYMSKFCRAELRDRGIQIDKEKVQYVREQAAVKFFLDQQLADVGAVASYSGVARGLEAAKLRVLHRSVQQPYFPMVAGPRLNDEQIRAIQAELNALPQSAGGKEVLATIGVQGFDTGSGARLQALLGWLGL